MSKKTKEKKKKNPSRVLQVLTKEYKYENLILGLALVTIGVLGIYLVSGALVLSIDFLSGKENVIGWIFVIFGFGVLLGLLFPFFKPSIEESKKVTYPKRLEVVMQSIKVFIFIMILVILFILAGFLFDWLFIDILKVV